MISFCSVFRFIAVVAFSFFAVLSSYAQLPADLDLNFNPADTGLIYPNIGANQMVKALALQADGKVVIGGDFTSFSQVPKNKIARLNTDGSIDQTFSIGTGIAGSLETLITQPDGKLIAGGTFTGYNGYPSNNIVRLKPTGEVDSAFTIGSGPDGMVKFAMLQADGKVIIGGDFISYNNLPVGRIARLNPDGSLDTSFNIGQGANLEVVTAAVQPDGKIIIGGKFTTFNGQFHVRSIALQPNGKIIIAGEFGFYNNIARGKLARLNSDGTLDVSFNSAVGIDQSASSSLINATAVLPDGKIIIAGNFSNYNSVNGMGSIARLHADGSLDVTFNSLHRVYGTVNKLVVQPDNKLMIGGSFIEYNLIFRGNVARLYPNSAIDPGFAHVSGPDSWIRSINTQPDGKIIVTGWFSDFSDYSRNGIARLNTDGTLDTTFVPGFNAFGSYHNTAIQPDGKIIAVGGFSSAFGIGVHNNIIRFNTDGSIDTSFHCTPGPGGYYETVHNVALQPDGKIIIVGAFSDYNGITCNRIARLHTDGTLDLTFDSGTGAIKAIGGGIGSLGALYDVKIQSDGKIVIGGDFQFYNGIPRDYIARLHTDGSLDMSFNPNLVFNARIMVIAIQPDGKILTGGDYSSAISGTGNVNRLLTDGTIDNTFISGSAYSGIYAIEGINIQSDGKIIVGGAFVNYNGVSRNKIARLHNDGSLDLAFNPGLGANND
ncbi:MAG: hypothetical protein EOO89_25435, partial [Pedobacter sp.]